MKKVVVLDTKIIESDYYSHVNRPYMRQHIFTALGEIGVYMTSKGLKYDMRYFVPGKGVTVTLTCTPEYWQRVLEPVIVACIKARKQEYKPMGGTDPESYKMQFYIKERV